MKDCPKQLHTYTFRRRVYESAEIGIPQPPLQKMPVSGQKSHSLSRKKNSDWLKYLQPRHQSFIITTYCFIKKVLRSSLSPFQKKKKRKKLRSTMSCFYISRSYHCTTATHLEVLTVKKIKNETRNTFPPSVSYTLPVAPT